jgi:MYXO-CTERM domain-containing protein
MRVLLLSVALQLLIINPASANTSLQAIDSAYASGSITEGQRLYYRVAAVKAPHLLPARFAGSASSGAPRVRSHFRVMLEAFRALGRVAPELRGPLQSLLLPPPDLAYTLDSTTLYPIRVSYALPSLAAKAQRVLEVAEIAYQTEVLDWGFWEPPIEPGAGLYRFYVEDAGGAAGYTAPYLENDATPHLDAFSYIVIDPSLDDVYLDTTVVHEFNHACQCAMDYGERVAFMENTASYVEAEIFPEGWWYTVATFPYFQSKPWRPLEYKATPTDIYEYGGALWVHFLAYLYGNEDPRWVRQIWEGTVQNGPINEPDYFDALDDMLGGVGGLAESIKTFSEYRYFIGADDDGQHLPGASEWWDSEVWRTATLSTLQLPVRDAAPADSSTRPMPNGCNYIVLEVSSAQDWPLRFGFRGDAGLRWFVNVMQVAQGQTTESAELTVDASGQGQLSLDVNALDEAVLVVCHLGQEGYDPDQHAWVAGGYHYTIEYDIPAPTVTGVSPDRIAQGAHGVSLSVFGTGFVQDPELAVSLSGNRVALAFEEYVSDQELRVTVTVTPDAELGPRSITVTNPGGSAGVGPGLLTIVSPGELPDAGPDGGTTPADPGPGCGCQAGGADPSPGLLLLLGVGLWLGGRRRRSARRRQTCTQPDGRLRHRRNLMARTLIASLLFFAALAAPLRSASAEPPWDGYVDSTVYPIRVHYTNSAGLNKANEALGYAEASWQLQIEQMGFASPTTEDATGNRIPGLWIFLDPDSPYDHAEPIGDNPDTSWTDCTMRVVVASLTPVSHFELVVYHEMNHALQMSADCGEADFAFENTTVAVTTLIWPEDYIFSEYFLPVFQGYPQSGLDCAFWDANRQYYHYGSSLFQLFLEDYYGDYDGTLMAAIWEAAKQDGTVTVGGFGVTMNVPNNPHLLNAIETALAGPTFDEAFVEFARWRYFVGLRDDGEHFTDGALWTGGEVALEADWTLAELPLATEVPTNLPNEYGSVYLTLDLDGIDDEHGVRFAVTADPTLTWNVDVLLLNPDGTADVQTLTLDAENAGEVTLENLVGYESALFIVSNLGDGTHTPDAPDCGNGATFYYDLEQVATSVPPQITSVDPTELLTGADHHVWINGAGFADGAQVSFGSADVQVTGVTFVDEATLSVDLAVAAGATPGPVSVTVTNPNALTDTLPNAVTLVAPIEPSPKDKGCGCATSTDSAPTGGLLLWLLLVGLALHHVRRRRRR